MDVLQPVRHCCGEPVAAYGDRWAPLWNNALQRVGLVLNRLSSTANGADLVLMTQHLIPHRLVPAATSVARCKLSSLHYQQAAITSALYSCRFERLTAYLASGGGFIKQLEVLLNQLHQIVVATPLSLACGAYRQSALLRTAVR
jgi:hypothetical protein